MAKWRLTEWLVASGEDRLIVMLEQLGDILGAPVPASATRHQPVCWSNTIADTHGVAANARCSTTSPPRSRSRGARE